MYLPHRKRTWANPYAYGLAYGGNPYVASLRTGTPSRSSCGYLLQTPYGNPYAYGLAHGTQPVRAGSCASIPCERPRSVRGAPVWVQAANVGMRQAGIRVSIPAANSSLIDDVNSVVLADHRRVGVC